MTTKIEAYHAARAVADRVAQAVHLSLGRDTPFNKPRFWCAFIQTLDGLWMTFQVEMTYGYGDASGDECSAASDEMGNYLALAIQKHKTLLLDTAAAMAASDAETARVAAHEEARAVLTNT